MRSFKHRRVHLAIGFLCLMTPHQPGSCSLNCKTSSLPLLLLLHLPVLRMSPILFSPCHLFLVPPICCLLLFVLLCFLSCSVSPPPPLLLPILCCNCENLRCASSSLVFHYQPPPLPLPSASPPYNRPCGSIWLCESCEGEWVSAASAVFRLQKSAGVCARA